MIVMCLLLGFLAGIIFGFIAGFLFGRAWNSPDQPGEPTSYEVGL